MSRFFNPDNPVMEFIAKIFDLVILNLIFIFSCVPIITIGASTSALSYVTLKMVRGEDPYIWRNFWKSFRQNFKQGTLVWIFSILIFIFLGMDFYIINSQNTSLFAVVRILLWIVCAVALSVFLYVFPVISHFVCTTKQALKNALLMTFGHLPYTLMMLALAGLLLFLCSSSSKLFAMIVVLSGICGFSVVSFVYSIMFDRIFQKYESETQNSAREPATATSLAYFGIKKRMGFEAQCH